MIIQPMIVGGGGSGGSGLEVLASGSWASEDSSPVVTSKPIKLALFKSYFTGPTDVDMRMPAFITQESKSCAIYDSTGNGASINMTNDTTITITRNNAGWSIYYIVLG
jgi:hypothetical protein|nr:MAG TPA: hypothetical protein [Caudoviricetes sp.]